MPPAKTRVLQEDSSSAMKEKLNAIQTNSTRGRRNGAASGANGSSLKEVVALNADTASTGGRGEGEQNGSSGMAWSNQDPSLLQGYRRAYRVDTPSSFKNPLSHVILGNGIGRYSPTMARSKAKRRVSKDQLGLAVRKNFNALAVNETDVIVDLLYKVKTQDKPFKVRFAPAPPRK